MRSHDTSTVLNAALVALLCLAGVSASRSAPGPLGALAPVPSRSLLMGEPATAGAAGPEAAPLPPVRVLVVRVGFRDRSGKPAFAPQCDEAVLKVGMACGSSQWGGPLVLIHPCPWGLPYIPTHRW
jgi:hypothetical protein